MEPNRISLTPDDEPHNEPVITTTDHLRERQDKSKMPWPDSEDRQQAQQMKDTAEPSERRTSRSRQNRTTKTRSPQSPGNSSQSDDTDPSVVKKKAVQRVVQRLKDQGMSDEFIKQNMDSIEKRVEKELL